MQISLLIYYFEKTCIGESKSGEKKINFYLKENFWALFGLWRDITHKTIFLYRVISKLFILELKYRNREINWEAR